MELLSIFLCCYMVLVGAVRKTVDHKQHMVLGAVSHDQKHLRLDARATPTHNDFLCYWGCHTHCWVSTTTHNLVFSYTGWHRDIDSCKHDCHKNCIRGGDWDCKAKCGWDLDTLRKTKCIHCCDDKIMGNRLVKQYKRKIETLTLEQDDANECSYQGDSSYGIKSWEEAEGLAGYLRTCAEYNLDEDDCVNRNFHQKLSCRWEIQGGKGTCKVSVSHARR